MADEIIERWREQERVTQLLAEFPVVAVLGARQVGKTTLARCIADRYRGPVARFDLEDPRDVARLADPMLSLEPLTGLVVLDEVQRRPEIFPTLRVLSDRRPLPARFLVLGSASPDLLRQTSESLAGRIANLHLGGLSLPEVPAEQGRRLWVRGGFPRSFLAADDAASRRWRDQMVRTWLEREIPALGITVGADTLRRFWTMLAHYHGQTWNGSELARAFAVSDKTVRHYLDILIATFMVRQLAPWHENLSKRQVKAPKVYLSDSGILHALLGIVTEADLMGHPKVGASFEGFALDEVVRRLGAAPEECYFWGLHTGAELDLLVVRGQQRRGFEFKMTDSPTVTPSMRSARDNLRLDTLDVIHAGRHVFPMADGIRAVGIDHLERELRALS
ncbi:MAG: ATP-binding protein [Deltaproteobacteria bacterium]|nr:ATP-binding protein [Deltaproteobacteria bacterium]